MGQRDISYWPAKPGRAKLKPAFVRALHMSRDRQAEAVAAIERTAEITYIVSTARSRRAAIGRAVA